MCGTAQSVSAPPLAVRDFAGIPAAGTQTGLTRDRAVQVGDSYGPGACKNVAPCVDYINPNSCALPATGGFGNVGKASLHFPGRTR